MDAPATLWELRGATGNTATCTIEPQHTGTVRLDVTVADRLAVTDAHPDMHRALAKARKILGELVESGWTVHFVADELRDGN